MASLSLEFSAYFRPELSKVEFSIRKHKYCSERGNKNTNKRNFSWSRAVQSLTILLLRYKLNYSPNFLEGEKSSLAASLDFAISKSPLWLIDMFGLDFNGSSLAKRLFKRKNSERKLPGPVAVYVNPYILEPSEIKISIGGLAVSDYDLTHLLAQLERQVQSCEEEKLSNLILEYKKDICLAFEQEIITTINSDDIFSKNSLKQTLKRIRANNIFAKYINHNQSIIAEEQFQYSKAELYGLSESQLILDRHLKGAELSIYLSHALPGTLALLNYLKYFKGYNFRINFNLASSVDTVSSIIKNKFLEPPDLCAVGLAAGAVLISNKSEYSPLMFMPRGSHQIVTSKNILKTKLSGRIGLMCDEAASALYHLDDLKQSGEIKNKSLQIENKSFDDIFKQINYGDPDFQAILTFPHYQFNKIFNQANFISLKSKLSNKQSFLFVHSRIKKNQALMHCLSLAFRDAWWVLKNNPIILQEVSQKLLADSNYLDVLTRFSGINRCNSVNC